jgi:hypothetical protein
MTTAPATSTARPAPRTIASSDAKAPPAAGSTRSAATAIARLNALAAELGRLGWSARLTAHPRTQPTLLIRDTAPGAPAIAEAIYAIELGQHWMYWWSRSCGPDPADAARHIAAAMRSPGHRTTQLRPQAVSDLRAPGGPTDPDELAMIAAGFPAFCIWREARYDGARYAAQARSLATRPAAVITRDLAELRAALTASSPPCGQ